MTKNTLVIAVLLLGMLSFAETPGNVTRKQPAEAAAKWSKENALAGIDRNASSTDCAFSFNSGSGFTTLSYCVTASGNITKFETPAGHPLISTSLGEGYGVCDASGAVAYSDFGGFGDSGNWGEAKVVSHDATSVQIARTTGDGIWTLTQTIRQGTTPPAAKIVMALTNNSKQTRSAFVMRYVDVDADGSLTNNLDATHNSALGWNSATGNEESAAFGLELQNQGTAQGDVSTGFIQDTPNPPAPCDAFAHSVQGPVVSTDGSLVMFYEPVVHSHKTVTMTTAYKGW